MDIEGILNRLIDFDEEISLVYDGKKFECIVVGGGALLLLGFISRATLDIDVLEASKEIVPFFWKIRYEYEGIKSDV